MDSKFELKYDSSSEVRSKLSNKKVKETFSNNKSKSISKSDLVTIKDFNNDELDLDISKTDNGLTTPELSVANSSLVNKDQLQKTIDSYSRSIKNFSQYQDLTDDVTTATHPELSRQMIENVIDDFKTIDEE
jgi:hypothetical protein